MDRSFGNMRKIFTSLHIVTEERYSIRSATPQQHFQFNFQMNNQSQCKLHVVEESFGSLFVIVEFTNFVEFKEPLMKEPNEEKAFYNI